MADTAPTAKIKALIAKALSTAEEFPEEARTCAFSAVRLIERHGFQIGTTASDSTDPRMEDLERQRSNLEHELDSVERDLDMLHTRAENLEQAFFEGRKKNIKMQAEIDRLTTLLRKKESKKGKKKTQYRRVKFSVDDLGSGRRMRAHYASFCRNCRCRIQKGDIIWRYGPTEGVLCMMCRVIECSCTAP